MVEVGGMPILWHIMKMYSAHGINDFLICCGYRGDYIIDDTTTLEQEPLQQMAREGQLSGYQHSGFWQLMDTLRDKNHLESLWDSGEPSWTCW